MGDVIVKPCTANKEDPYVHVQDMYSEYFPRSCRLSLPVTSITGSGMGSTWGSGVTEKLMLTYKPLAPGATSPQQFRSFAAG